MNTGIYEIRNSINNKKYIGSACRIDHRWHNHKSLLKKNAHHSRYLQNSWNKYGENVFIFRVLLFCDKQNNIFYEQICIDKFRPEYNINPTAESSLGSKASEETKKKMSIARRNRPPCSEETRKKMSETLKKQLAENPDRPRFRLGSKSRLGQHPNEETRKKMSSWQKGRKLSELTKEKIGITMSKRKITWGDKISESKKKWWKEHQNNKPIKHKCYMCGKFTKLKEIEANICDDCLQKIKIINHDN